MATVHDENTIMTTIQKILTSRFGNLAIDVIKAGHTEPGITRKQLGEMLGNEHVDLTPCFPACNGVLSVK